MQIENTNKGKSKISDEIKFTISFKEKGESFQNIIEKILIDDIIKN